MSSTNEQSMLQMHERERKLKELQAKLAEDNTPEKKADDSQKNVSQSSPSVFDRLYAHKKQSTPVKSTPKKAPATPGSTSRINALYESGQKGLRSKVMTAKVRSSQNIV